MKALVIDDDSLVRLTVREVLSRWGHEVVVAENGTEGLRVAQEGDFDIIVCDLEMPGMHGTEVFEELTPEKQNKFVLHTGNMDAPGQFGDRMRVIMKSAGPLALRDILYEFSKGAA